MRKLPKSIKCGICGKRFRGKGAIGRLSRHRARKHPTAKRKHRKKTRKSITKSGAGPRVERSQGEIHIHING